MRAFDLDALLLCQLAFLCTFLTVAVQSSFADTPDPKLQDARRALEKSAQAYREIQALQDTMSYSVAAPGSEQETKTQEYGFGPNKTTYVRNALLQAVATDGKLFLTQTDVADRYVAAPYDDDLGPVLHRIAGNGSLFDPPPLEMHNGKSVEAFVDTLRFNLLEPLQIADYRRDDSGADIVHFTANNGTVDLVIDGTTHLFKGIALAVHPAGAPPEMLVRVNGTFAPKIISAAESHISFDPGQRSAVATLADLISKRLTAGTAAPDFELTTLDGRKVSLTSLHGSIVVLDFWAAWCVPCWTALKESQALSNWAAANNLQVAVLPVNTMEQGTDNVATLSRVTTFWKSQKFSMTSLLDIDSKMFKSYGHPGLPSVVVISRDGMITHYHEGLMPDMAETLKKEIAETR